MTKSEIKKKGGKAKFIVLSQIQLQKKFICAYSAVWRQTNEISKFIIHYKNEKYVKQ